MAAGSTFDHEGGLSKWTNYLSGWQPRYFTVKDGMLSYYADESDVGKACRGSINLATAELTVRGDALHFDVTGLNSTIYLKANSLAQRQKWVLAIANAKSRGDSTDPTRPGSPRRGSAGPPLTAVAHRIDGIRRELLAVASEFEAAARLGDVSKAAAADEARRLARQVLQLLSMGDAAAVAAAAPAPPSAATMAEPGTRPLAASAATVSPSHPDKPRADDGGAAGEAAEASKGDPIRAAEEHTFFSSVPTDFSGVLGVGAADGAHRITAASFLTAAAAVLPFIDRLGSALAIVKSDISGNIDKIRAAYARGGEDCVTLEDIVREEVRAKRTTASDSASDALLWLKRALRFICAFLREVADGKETTSAAGLAYSRTLAHYHGWLVRGAFSMAMKSVPYRNDLLKQLGPGPEHLICEDALQYVADLDAVLTAVDDLLASFGLNKDEKV
mmetsp:Transcript_3618/g.8993  ORF Transcript_3618/g.8993 Transcript_3618/m.8993 type:complete len:446 (-) Transcript_3618:66-1403(-)